MIWNENYNSGQPTGCFCLCPAPWQSCFLAYCFSWSVSYFCPRLLGAHWRGLWRQRWGWMEAGTEAELRSPTSCKYWPLRSVSIYSLLPLKFPLSPSLLLRCHLSSQSTRLHSFLLSKKYTRKPRQDVTVAFSQLLLLKLLIISYQKWNIISARHMTKISAQQFLALRNLVLK